jgi:hypothetical protein
MARKFQPRADHQIITECPALPDHPGEQAAAVAAWISSVPGVRLARWWRSDREQAAAPVEARAVVRVYIDWVTPYVWNNGTGTSFVEIVPTRRFEHRDPPTLRDRHGAAVEFTPAFADSVAAIAREFRREMT